MKEGEREKRINGIRKEMNDRFSKQD